MAISALNCFAKKSAQTLRTWTSLGEILLMGSVLVDKSDYTDEGPLVLDIKHTAFPLPLTIAMVEESYR